MFLKSQHVAIAPRIISVWTFSSQQTGIAFLKSKQVNKTNIPLLSLVQNVTITMIQHFFPKHVVCSFTFHRFWIFIVAMKKTRFI